MKLVEIIELLKLKCDEAGSQARWAKENGLSQAYVNDVIRGTRAPGPKILAAVGLEGVMDYRYIPHSQINFQEKDR